MARFHWWSFLVNEEGQPIEGADISIYLAGTNEPAYIFEDEFSGAPNNTLPQITSQENGYFEFWVPDVDEIQGYSPLQKFKIYWEKVGITEGWIDYVDIFPPIIPVNELDTDPTKIKAVSNLLAHNWEQHRLDTSHVVHGIDEVNEDIQNDIIRNKLISNDLAYQWDGHTSSLVNDTSTHQPSGTYPHNIKPLDLTQDTPDDQYQYNRVPSWYQGNLWNEHVESDYNETPHGIEEVNENDSDETKNKLVSNDLIRQLYYQHARVKRFNIYATDWFINGDGDYQVNIEHDLEEEFPLVQTWALYDKEVLYISNIISIDAWNTKLINNIELDLKVIISS